MKRLTIALILFALAASACGRSQSDSEVLVGVPGLVNEHGSAASDGRNLVALAWSASSEAAGANIYASVSIDGGTSFSAPVRVNAVDRPANVNGEQPPRVAVVKDTSHRQAIVVLWTARGADGTLLLSARSPDGGRTFEPATELPGVDAPGNRGWESMAAAGDGQLYALWLDHRDTARTGSSHAMHHQHGPGTPASMDGVARAQQSQLFVGSIDGSLEPKSIARGVCYCCKTAVATGQDGTVYAAWRHVYEGNRRDIAFTMSRDGGRSFDPPVRVSEDNWQLDGCPENGPAMGLDSTGRIHVVWPTLVRESGGETLGLFHASSTDGRTFTPRVALPTTGAANHPQLVVGPGGVLLAAWDELQSGTRRVRLARGQADNDGGFVFSQLRTTDEPAGAYPALAATADHAVLAWTQRGQSGTMIAVKRVD